MRLFIVHAGFYDDEIGIYELHTNFLVAAENISDVKNIVKKKDVFIRKKMHIDAVQEIEAVDGHKIMLVKEESNTSKLRSYDYKQMKQLD